jgi:hypothetical protein
LVARRFRGEAEQPRHWEENEKEQIEGRGGGERFGESKQQQRHARDARDAEL